MDVNAKVYVAGHRGLVGSAIVRELRRKGFSNILTRASTELDLTDQAAVRGFLAAEKPQYVFLAAAKVGGIHANNVHRGEFIYKNLMIQTNVLHHAYECGVRRLVFLGSSCVYPRMAPQPIREEHLLTGPLEATNSPYAVAKIAGIEMCDAYNRQYGTSYLAVMPTNLYGPGDNFDLLGSHVLPALMRKFHLARLAQQGRMADIAADEARLGPIPDDVKAALGLPPHPARTPTVPLWGTGSALREFLHVDDMAAACVHLMFHSGETRLTNIGVGQDVTIREVAEMIREIVGFTGDIAWDATKPDGTPRKLLDVSRLHGLGWKAAIPLAEGLRRTYAWYVEQAGG